MRKCSECGYLVPEVWETCRKCGAAIGDAVARVAGLVAASIAPLAPAPAPALATTSSGFDARYSGTVRLGPPGSGAASAAAGTAPGAVFERVPTQASQWSEGTQSRVPTPWARRFVSLVVVVALGAGAWFGWQWYTAVDVPAGTEAFVDGGGVDHAGPGYTARFPIAPVVEPVSQTIEGTVLTADAAHVSGAGYEMLVMAVDVPQLRGLGDPRAGLAGAIAGVLSGSGSSMSDQRNVDHDGHPAVEVDATSPRDHPLRVRAVLAGPTLYLLVVESETGADVLYDELVDSLALAAAPPATI